MNTYGLLYLVAGECALLLAGFGPRPIWESFRNPSRRTGRLFEAVARNALALGALLALVDFSWAVRSPEGGAAQFLAQMAGSWMSAFYGMAIAVPFGIAAAARYRRNGTGEPAVSDTTIFMWLGYALLAGLLAWVLAPAIADWRAGTWIFPIAGGAFLALLYGGIKEGTGASLGFASSGLLGGVWGLLRALGAFSGGEIPPIAAALSFAVQSCSLGLAGMLLAGYPAQDRSPASIEPGALSRIAWYGTPLAALFILSVVILMVITPVEKVSN